MRDIDWLAVYTVCTGTPVKLSGIEKKMVMRRLEEKMLRTGESSFHTNKLTAAEVANRLNTTERSICRYLAELREAEKRCCPVCRQDMWVYSDGSIEPHPDSLLNECPMSGSTPYGSRKRLHGLAAIRPDLYEWVSA